MRLSFFHFFSSSLEPKLSQLRTGMFQLLALVFAQADLLSEGMESTKAGFLAKLQGDSYRDHVDHQPVSF